MGNAVLTKWRVDIAETALAFRRYVIGFSPICHWLFGDIPMPFRDNCRRWKPLDSAHFNVIDWCTAIWLIRFITGVIWTMGVLIGFMPLHNVKNTWKKRTLSARVLYQYGRWKGSALKLIGSSNTVNEKRLYQYWRLPDFWTSPILIQPQLYTWV